MKTFSQFKEQMVAPTNQVVKGQRLLDLRTSDEKMTALKKRAQIWKDNNLYNKKP
jgi:hypothetical protein